MVTHKRNVIAVLIAAAIFFAWGVGEQMNATARACSKADGEWVNPSMVSWFLNPEGACER